MYPIARPNAAPVAPAPANTRTTLAINSTALSANATRSCMSTRPIAVNTTPISITLLANSATTMPLSGQVAAGIPYAEAIGAASATSSRT